MGEVERYPDGTFCWIDLGTTDVEGAKAFYGGLLGWEFEDLPAQEGSYTMCRLRGRDVAGIHRHAEEEGTGWSSNVSVGDLDRATARARCCAAVGWQAEVERSGVNQLPEHSR
jgi:predicted enzyme related to lactoylglutathione lyase